MNNISSKLNIKVGVTLAMSSFVIFSLVLAVAPRTIDHAKAEDCEPVYSQAIFDPYTPYDWGTTAGSDCHDFAPLAGGVHGSGVWSNNVNANVGDTVTLRVYVHNAAATNSGVIMHNTHYNVNLDASAGSSHNVGVQLTASNAAELDGSISINTPAGSSLQYVSCSSSVGSPCGLSSYVTTPGQANGDLAACFGNAQLFYITLQVVGPTTPPPVVTPPAVNSSVALSITNFCVGQKSFYTVQGSSDLAGDDIYWSSTKNGSSTGEVNDNYGQTLNSSAYWSGSASQAWTTNDIGSWTKTVGVLKNGQAAATSQPFAFTVSNCGGTPPPPPPVNSTVTLSITNFCVGQNPTYTITGSSDLANDQIYWSSTLNGSSTGEVNDNYGQVLGNDARLVIQGNRAWTTADIGSWTKTVGVLKNGQAAATSQPFAFTVSNCGGTPPPPVNSTVTLYVSGFCVGTVPTYTVQGSSNLAGDQIYWSSTLNGSSTGEVNANYNGTGQTQILNSTGYWSGPGNRAWTTADIGSWTKTVGVLKNGQAAATSQPFAFTVSNCGGTPPPPVCQANSNFALNAATPIKTGSSYSVQLTWTSTGNNQIKITEVNKGVSTETLITTGSSSGNFTLTGLQAGQSYVFKMYDALCGGFLTSVEVVTPANPGQLICSANVSSANVGDDVLFTASGGGSGYTWATSNNSDAANGTVFNVNFASGGNKNITVTSGDGQTATCGVFINTPVQQSNTGNCNNDSNSCNNNTNNNTQTGSGTNSSNQNNNTNVNGNNNTITNTNNNCVNNSCNNTSTNNYSNTTYAPPVYPVYNYTQPTPVYNYPPPQPVYVASNNYVPAVLGGNVNLTYSKSAFNNSKNANATSVTASKEDRITYTLTVTNTGNTPDNGFVVSDDLSQVLPYADVVDDGGGYVSGNTISFPAVTVPADGSVQESFQVVVKFSLSSNLTYTMVNTYGNTVTININTPQVLGAFTAPTTGADTNAFIFAGLLTSGFALFMKRKALAKLIFT